MKLFECKNQPGRYYHPSGHGTLSYWAAAMLYPEAEFITNDKQEEEKEGEEESSL